MQNDIKKNYFSGFLFALAVNCRRIYLLSEGKSGFSQQSSFNSLWFQFQCEEFCSFQFIVLSVAFGLNF